jgi:hypothetical protein
MINDLTQRRLDIVMAGAYVTEPRLEELAATTPYFQSPVAFIARAARARHFLHYSQVANAPDLKLGVLQESSLAHLAAHLFPKAQIVPLTTYDEFADRPDLDAVVVIASSARLGLRPPGLHGGCRKRHGSAAHVFLFSAARRHDADPLPKCLARAADGERLSCCADRLLDRRQAARATGAALEFARQRPDPGLVAFDARSSPDWGRIGWRGPKAALNLIKQSVA